MAKPDLAHTDDEWENWEWNTPLKTSKNGLDVIKQGIPQCLKRFRKKGETLAYAKSHPKPSSKRTQKTNLFDW